MSSSHGAYAPVQHSSTPNLLDSPASAGFTQYSDSKIPNSPTSARSGPAPFPSNGPRQPPRRAGTQDSPYCGQVCGRNPRHCSRPYPTRSQSFPPCFHSVLIPTMRSSILRQTPQAGAWIFSTQRRTMRCMTRATTATRTTSSRAEGSRTSGASPAVSHHRRRFPRLPRHHPLYEPHPREPAPRQCVRPDSQHRKLGPH
ncbi:hypothetical protein K438DRAFT_1261296 [Mycena galopus ATCC 62051]|nr:hypothetical protein K438DRAFT_1261296 [Mycena galopus ATCC 62051]